MLKGSVVTLCPFDRRHIEPSRNWANDMELARLLDRGRPVCDVEHEQWALSLSQKKDAVFFAIETNEEAHHIGNIWLWDIDARHRKAEVRIVIGDTTHTGRGMGTECIQLLSSYAKDRLNLRRLYAYTLSSNPRAKRAFEKAGFEMEGLLREDRWNGERYVDVCLLGLLI